MFDTYQGGHVLVLVNTHNKHVNTNLPCSRRPPRRHWKGKDGMQADDEGTYNICSIIHLILCVSL